MSFPRKLHWCQACLKVCCDQQKHLFVVVETERAGRLGLGRCWLRLRVECQVCCSLWGWKKWIMFGQLRPDQRKSVTGTEKLLRICKQACAHTHTHTHTHFGRGLPVRMPKKLLSKLSINLLWRSSDWLIACMENTHKRKHTHTPAPHNLKAPYL